MSFFLQHSDIIRHVGPISYERGKSYFLSGRVAQFNRIDSTLSALVLGGQPSPYETRIQLDGDKIADSVCTCPMGSACKHVAAVALNDAASPARRPHSGFAEGWSQSMQDWFKESSPKTSGQLRLILRIDSENTFNRAAAGRLQLQFRPQIYYPDENRLSFSDISWKNYLNQTPYRSVNSVLDQNQNCFLSQLAQALSVSRHYYAWDEKWFSVNQDNARPVWDILSRAGSSGVCLYNDEKNGALIPADPVSFTVKTTLEDTKEGLSVKNSLWLGETPAQEAMLFGSPVVFGVLLKIKMIHSGRVPHFEILSIHPSSPVSAAIVESAAPANGPILVPTKDIPTFAEKYLPRFPRSLVIENLSRQIVPPVQMPPKACIDILGMGGGQISVFISWKYGETKIAMDSKKLVIDGGVGKMIARDYDAEKKIFESLENFLRAYPYFWKRAPGEAPTLLACEDKVILIDKEAAYFLTVVIPLLRTLPGVEILLDPNAPRLAENIDPKAEFTLEEEENNSDWFDLGMNVIIEGESVNFEKVFGALSKKEDYLFLPSGRFVSLKHPFFENLQNLIRQAEHLRDRGTGQIRLSRFQAGWWSELIRLGVVKQQAARWKESVNGLLDFKKVPILPQPEKFHGNLRHYQAEGYSWMSFLREKNMGGVLADDMGLGKTVQAVSLAARGASSFLIIAPTSVVENWDMEFEKFAPHLKKTILRRGDRSRDHQAMPSADIVVVSYALFQRDQKHFLGRLWDTVIFDEAQFVKNYQSKAYGVLRRLKARCKFALTGTPLENNLMELWSIFSITSPGLFPEPEKFRELFQKPIEKNNDKKALESLRAHIRPFILRRLKENVEKELPPKTEQAWILEMGSQQKHVYQVHLQKERQKVLGLLEHGGMKSHRFEIFTSLMRLRQLCLHAVLVDKKYSNIPSAKLDALVDRLETILTENHRVLIFSQFTSFLGLVKKCLKDRGWKYAYLDGATRNRKETLESFQKDASVPIFLISLKAGGFGLNLTSADYCILLDPWWNPAVESQAIDRTHRIGQTRHVMVYRPIMRDTIEEKVVKLQEKKRQLFRSILDDGNIFSNLVTEADIRGIFG